MLYYSLIVGSIHFVFISVRVIHFFLWVERKKLIITRGFPRPAADNCMLKSCQLYFVFLIVEVATYYPYFSGVGKFFVIGHSLH